MMQNVRGFLSHVKISWWFSMVFSWTTRGYQPLIVENRHVSGESTNSQQITLKHGVTLRIQFWHDENLWTNQSNSNRNAILVQKWSSFEQKHFTLREKRWKYVFTSLPYIKFPWSHSEKSMNISQHKIPWKIKIKLEKSHHSYRPSPSQNKIPKLLTSVNHY